MPAYEKMGGADDLANTPAVVDVLKSIYAQLGANDVANIPNAAEMIEKITEAAESGRSLTKGDTTMTINTIAEALKKLYAKLGGTDNVADVPTVAEMIDKVTEVAGTGSGGLPEVTAADNGKTLSVVNGEWAAERQFVPFIIDEDTLLSNLTARQVIEALSLGRIVYLYYGNISEDTPSDSYGGFDLISRVEWNDTSSNFEVFRNLMVDVVGYAATLDDYFYCD